MPRHTLVLTVHAELDDEAQTEGETTATFSKKVARLFAGNLHRQVKTIRLDTQLDPRTARTLAYESRDYRTSRRYCETQQANLLLTISVEAPADVSEIVTANWPELYMYLFDCKRGTRVSERYDMAPKRDDLFVYSASLDRAFYRFLERYKHRLAP